MDHGLLNLAILIVTGIAAQWLAWRVHLPSILLLLIGGFVLGRFMDTEHLFGEFFEPLVAISVALILFEGGLELRLHELRQVGRAVILLVTLGIALSWVTITTAAYYLLNFEFTSALLLGAILVVTGPTVVGPLLRQIRPHGQVGAVLKWEGILNDAVGAVLAVLVFEALLAGQLRQAPIFIVTGVAMTIVLGLGVGLVAAAILVELLRRRWVPDQLDVAVTLAFVVGAFAISNYVQSESGLLTVTVMGIYVINQKYVDVRHLVEFKENLRMLLLSALFVLLAARIEPEALMGLGLGSIVFVAVLILVVRPLVAFVCTAGGGYSRNERVFIGAMAPRGIVAAAVASVFGIQMAANGMPNADEFAPTVFFVIAVTVAFYGLSAGPLARKLELAHRDRQGILIVGAHILPRQIALALQKEGFKVLLVDINRRYVTASRLAGVSARHGDALSEQLLEDLDLSEMGKLFAMTANDTVNSLAALNFSEVFGRDNVYQAAQEASEMPGAEEPGLPRHLRGRTLFGDEITHAKLSALLRRGGAVRATKITSEFSYDHYLEKYHDDAIPLFIVTEDNKLKVRTRNTRFEPVAGQKVIALINEQKPEGALSTASDVAAEQGLA